MATKQTDPLELFEQELLSYTALCYAMACELTHNPEEAADLAREELMRARQICESVEGARGIKMELLAGLWRRFLDGDFGKSRPIEKDSIIEEVDVPRYTERAIRYRPVCSQGLRTRVAASRPGDGRQESRPGFRECAARYSASGMGRH